MAIFDDTGGGADPAVPQGNWFTQKLGPLPMWAWIGAGVAGYFLYSRYKSSKSTAATSSTSSSDSGTDVNGSTTQTGEDVIVTETEPGATSEVTPTTPTTAVTSPVVTAASVTGASQAFGLENALANQYAHLTAANQAKLKAALGYVPTGTGAITGDNTSAYEQGVTAAANIAKLTTAATAPAARSTAANPVVAGTVSVRTPTTPGATSASPTSTLAPR